MVLHMHAGVGAALELQLQLDASQYGRLVVRETTLDTLTYMIV
jgi:hypothetical protein